PRQPYFCTSSRLMSDITEEKDLSEHFTPPLYGADISDYDNTDAAAMSVFYPYSGNKEFQPEITNITLPRAHTRYSSGLRRFHAVSEVKKPYLNYDSEAYFGVKDTPNRTETPNETMMVNHADTQGQLQQFPSHRSLASIAPQEGKGWNFFDEWRAAMEDDFKPTFAPASRSFGRLHMDQYNCGSNSSHRDENSVKDKASSTDGLDGIRHAMRDTCTHSKNISERQHPIESYCGICEKDLYEGAMIEPNTVLRIYLAPEKDEVLGVRDSPFAEEYTDSGIENSKVSPYRHSPSTSSELSPQGDWIRSRDYNVDPTDISNYVVQASWQIQHSPKHSSTSSMRPFEGLQQRVARYDPQTTHVDTLLRVDDSQHQTLEKDVDKQAFIGSSERSSRGSKAEVDSSRQASRGTAVVSSRAVKGTVSELAAKFECSQSHEPKHDVEKVFPVAHKERTANHIQTVKNDSLGSNETNLETINARRDDGQNIKLGVELCREQTANVTAVKFPTRQQKCATMRSFKEFPEASRKENDDVANTYKASSSYVPYTAANLAAIKERASLGESSNTTPPATVKKEPPEPPARPHDPPSKNVEDASRRVQSVMCTVEIPFEDVPGAAYQPNNTDQHEGTLPDADGIMIVNIDLGHHTKNPRKYFGFTVAGGKDKDAALRVESVIAGTPADECGLQVGDLILSVNGETVDDRYHQSVIRMLHEAARLGEVELKIKRVSCFAETEHERQHIASSLSEVDDARPKLVRNYDITPLRSDPASPVQQKIVGFTKRAEEMTYIPLSKKPPPVPQKPSPPPPPPSSTLPPEEEEEDHDDDTQPGRSFVRKQLRQQIGLSQQDDTQLKKHQTMRPTYQSASEADVDNSQKLPTIDGIRNLVTADSVNHLNYENETQSRTTARFSPLTSCSWVDSAASTLSGPADSNEPTPAESRSGSSRAQQPVVTTYTDGDKRVTFGRSETHEITPRQTQEIIFPVAQPLSPQEVHQNDSRDKDTYQTVARYGFGAREHGPCSIERIHPIQLSGQPDPERRMVFSRADQGEKNTATAGYSNEKRVRDPERIAISPKLISSHFIKVRCRSCNDLLDNVSHDQRNLNDANNSKKPSSPIT
uniref:LIM and calponin homology domains-containing protein 1 n=1 Tax=Parascaris univalens TaxID=6257 RepID=A0A915B9X6_PARUN